MLTCLITAVCIWGMMKTVTMEPAPGCSVCKYEKIESLNGKYVTDTPNITDTVENAIECAVFCARNPDCVYFRLKNKECSTFTTIVTTLLDQSLPGAVYYMNAASNPCLRIPGYHYLPAARLCVCGKFNNTDVGSVANSKTACKAIGGRLIVLDSLEKQHYVQAYLDSLGAEAINSIGGWGVYTVHVGMEIVDGVYKWSTGSIFVAQWGTDEPDLLPSQTCVYLRPTGMNDGYCNYIRGYMCEIIINP